MPKQLNIQLHISDLTKEGETKEKQYTLSFETEVLMKMISNQSDWKDYCDVAANEKIKYSPMNFGIWYNVVFLVFIRTLMAVYCTTNFIHPDEYYQGTEVAYNMVFGNVEVTWEWWDENRIRGVIYPSYLSIPLRILKYFQIDSPTTIRLSYYFAHEILVVVGDIFFFKTIRKLEGLETAQITMYLFLAMKNFNIYYVKCFGNSVETVLTIIIFYFLTGVSRKLDDNLIRAVALMVMQMFIRCTSCAAWVPLLLFKVYKYPKLFHKYILVGFYVAIPIFAYCVYLDTMYYGRFTLSLFNFVQKNIVEDISSHYGVSEPSYYIFRTLPYSFNFATIPLFYQFIKCIINNIGQRKITFYLIYPITLISLLSYVPHKEDRFILPAIPYLLVLVAIFYRDAFRTKFRVLFKLLFFITVVYEVVIFVGFSRYFQRRQDPINFITQLDLAPPSYYHANRFDLPYYTLTHNRLSQGARYFAKHHQGNFGGVVQNIYPDDNIFQCKDVIGSIKYGWWPPKYLIINSITNEPRKDCCKSKDEYLYRRSQLYQMEDCTSELDLEAGYKLIGVFQNKANEDFAFLQQYGIDIDWGYYLRVEFQPVYVYRHENFIDYSNLLREVSSKKNRRGRGVFIKSKLKYHHSVYVDVYKLLFKTKQTNEALNLSVSEQQNSSISGIND